MMVKRSSVDHYWEAHSMQSLKQPVIPINHQWIISWTSPWHPCSKASKTTLCVHHCPAMHQQSTLRRRSLEHSHPADALVITRSAAAVLSDGTGQLYVCMPTQPHVWHPSWISCSEKTTEGRNVETMSKNHSNNNSYNQIYSIRIPDFFCWSMRLQRHHTM